MRKWFQSVAPDRDKLLAIRWMRPIAHWLTDPVIWHFNRHAVARGTALGLFVSFVFPIGQVVRTALFASIARGNVLIAAAATFLVNPITFPAVYYGAYRLGGWLMGVDVSPAALGDQSMSQILTGASGPLLVGLIIFAMTSAIIGYVLVQGAWRVSLVRRWRRRAAER